MFFRHSIQILRRKLHQTFIADYCISNQQCRVLSKKKIVWGSSQKASNTKKDKRKIEISGIFLRSMNVSIKLRVNNELKSWR